MISFWQQSTFLTADICIIGGGIIGISTALSIRERKPDCRITVVEQSPFPAGASTRNAGFACFGSLTEIIADRALRGDRQTLDILQMRRNGLQILRSRIPDSAMRYEDTGGFELLWKGQEHALEHINEVNQLLQPILGKEYFSLLSPEQFGFGNDVAAVIKAPAEGVLHSGYALAALHTLARNNNIQILCGMKMLEFQEHNNYVEISCTSNQSEYTLRASAVVFATNAHIGTYFPRTDIVPGRGQIILTEPIHNLQWKGAFHSDEGYYYFRHIGNQILLGGGRNTDFAGEQTFSVETTAAITEHLYDYLCKHIIPNHKPPAIQQQWAGTMGFTPTKEPIVDRQSERTVLAFGCNGMGVAIGSIIGERAAMLV